MAKTLAFRGDDHDYGRVGHRKHWFVGMLLFISLLFSICLNLMHPGTTHAAQTIPYKMNFQGRLTDASGNIKPDGNYNIKFRLMSASSGGTNLWEADRVRGASDYRVQVTNGLFSIQLGDTSQGDPALSPTLFNTGTNATVYLEVELPTPATATCATNGCATFTEGAMTPRSLLASAAYAFNADTVDGIDGSSLARVDATNTFTASNTYNSGTTNTYNGAVVHNNTDTIANNQVLGLNIQGTAGSYTLQNAGIGTYLYTDGTLAHLGVTATASGGASVTPGDNSNDVLQFASAGNTNPAMVNLGAVFGENLVENGGFEYGCAGWVPDSTATAPATCETSNPRTGNKDLKIAKSTSAGWNSVYEHMMAVSPGETMYMQGYTKTSVTTNGTGGLAIVFFDANLNSLGSTASTVTNPGTTYALRTVTATAPANTALALLYPFVNGDGSTGGNWYFDDLYAVKVNRPAPLLIQNTVDGTALQVKNASGSSTLLSLDTSASKLVLGAETQSYSDMSLLGISGGYGVGLNFNQTWNGTNFVTQNTGPAGNMRVEPDNALHLRVASSKTAGGTVTDQDVLQLYAPNDTISGMANMGVKTADSLYDNSKFELGCIGWTGCTADASNPHLGNGAAKYVMSASTSAGTINGPLIAAQQNDIFYAEGWIKTTAGTTGTANVKICYYDKDAGLLSCDSSTGTNPGTTYTQRTIKGNAAPANTAYVAFQFKNNGDGSAAGTWYYDDFYATKVNRAAPVLLQNTADSAAAFQVQKSTGDTMLNVDTTNSQVTVGGNNSATLPTLVVSQTGAGDTGIQVKNATNNFFAGIDASDGSKFKLGASGNTTAGVTVNSANYDSGNANLLIMNLVQAATTGTVSTVHAHVGAVSGNIAAAIYADNGSQTGPSGAALATSNSTALSANSWQAISLTSSASVTAGSYYWIATNVSSNTTQQDFQSISDGIVTGAFTSTVTFGTWPSSPSVTLSGSTGWATNMDIVAGAVTDEFAATAFSLGQGGQATYKNIANSTTAFQIQTSAGANLLVADTVNQAIKIGGGDVSANDTPTLLVLDWKTGALDPSNGVDGAMYYNDNTLNFRCYRNNAWHSCSDGLVASNTSVPGGNTVASTASETNFASNYSIPANDCQPGRVYKVWARGVYGTTGSPNLTLRVKIGTTNVGVTSALPPGNSVTNQGWSVDFNITCITMSSSGTVEGQGYAVISTGTAAANTDEMQNTAVSSTINFTTSQTLQLSAQWGTSSSSNTITLRQLVVESLGPA